jgi:hypothetical protein
MTSAYTHKIGLTLELLFNLGVNSEPVEEEINEDFS